MSRFFFPADNNLAVPSDCGKPSQQRAAKKAPLSSGFSRGFSSFLDFSRWLAAFVVFAGHLRNPIFIGYPDLPGDQRSYLVSAFYFLSGLGTSSVIVFFVLSGFLVGGIGLAKVRAGKFDASNYTIDRFVRLFIVYIPALILIYILDSIGNHFFGDAGLWNCGSTLMCKNFSDFSQLLTWKNFFTNLFMLQSFYGPYFGTGKPLWSLSYEFWFYVEFGLLALCLLNERAVRGICVMLALCVAAFLGFRFVLLLGVWSIGIAVSVFPREKLVYPKLSIVAFVLSSFAMRFGALESASGIKDYVLIYANALSFAWVMISLRSAPLRTFELCEPFNKVLASFSYTLYLLHFSLMLFIVGAITHFLDITQILHGFMPTSLTGLALYLSALIVVPFLCWLVAQCTERHTDDMRALLKSRLLPRLPVENNARGLIRN